jgi:hypothetical protein
MRSNAEVQKMVAERFGGITGFNEPDFSVRSLPIDKVVEDARRAFVEQKTVIGDIKSLWPAPYNNHSYEARLAFIYDKVYTWHEQNGAPEPILPRAYIDWYVWHWADTRAKGLPMQVEKCRRMIVSWITRGLEVHDLGVTKGGLLLAGQKYDDAEAFVWRC